MTKATLCLWYDDDAEGAAAFYAATFPDSRITGVHRGPIPARSFPAVLTCSRKTRG
jgi:predicted 3-demethylubiquinone-9 3-methyltransferase (glyoxalase superfamily)